MTTARKLLVTLLVWLPTILVGASWLAWSSRLGPQVPTHWGASGPANDASSTIVMLSITLAITAAAAVFAMFFIWRAPRNPWVSRGIVGVSAATSALMAATWLLSAGLSLDVSDPYTVVLGGWVLAALAAPLYGLVPLFLVGKGYTRPVEPTDEIAIEPVALAPGQTAATSSWVFSPLFVWLTVFMAALAALTLFMALRTAEQSPPLWVTGLLAVSVLGVSVLAAYRVTADWRGLRVTSWMFGIPLKRILLGEIKSASAAVLEPGEWGGWGYRVMPGRTAIIRRRGPGLVIDKTDGVQFAVSIDNPAEEASVLLGLKAQQRTIN